MTTERQQIVVHGIPVEVVRKDIKNLHLAVYPPNGRVRLAVPVRIGDETARLAVIERLAWIRRQQILFDTQERQSEREMVSGESHFFEGRRYRLNVIERAGPPDIRLRHNRTLELGVPSSMNSMSRRAVLDKWYRKYLKERVPALIAKWEPVVGAKVTDWRIKRMKTRWGSCIASKQRLWLNVELAKKPFHCLELVVVHEMVHLLERHHNDRFRQLMNSIMPQWQLRREELNRSPLAHEAWAY